jgi:hypothetical protein
MTGFDDREKAFEEQFAHDQELIFKVRARRDSLFGLWAAEKMGLAEEAAAAYAKEVVAADFHKRDESAIVAKVGNDLAARGVRASEAQLRDEFRRVAAQARKVIVGE